jgi:hypothetical protein
MLTDRPHIVIAKAPKRIKLRSKPKITRYIVGRNPQEDADRDYAAGDAADRLFKEMVRRVNTNKIGIGVIPLR